MSPKDDKKKKKIYKKENAPVKKGAKPAARINKDKIVIEQLTKQLTDVEDKQLRLKAEFENFRKRKEKETYLLLNFDQDHRCSLQHRKVFPNHLQY